MEEICEKLKRGNINANCFCKEHDPRDEYEQVYQAARRELIGEIEKEVDRLYDKRGPGDHGSGEAYAYMTVQEILANYKK